MSAHMVAEAAVTLEPLALEDFERAAKWLSNPAVNRWLTPEWRNRQVTASVIAIAVRNRRNRFFLFRYGGLPCGIAALADLELLDSTAMVWYLLGESGMAGKGITSLAVRELARISFEEIGLTSLYAWAMEDNLASLKVLRNSGFRESGRLRQAVRSGDRQVDRIYFDRIASDSGDLKNRS